MLHFASTISDPESLKGKINAIKNASNATFRFYNANVETLLYSFGLDRSGGFSGISANFYPHLHSWMLQQQQQQ